MIDTEKKQFWLMINVTMELTNKPPLTKEAIIVWWSLLKKHEFNIVERAINQWVDSSSKPPTPHDIVGLCKPREPDYKALSAPVDHEANKQYAANVVIFVAENTKEKTDLRGWARDLISGKKISNQPDLAIKMAKEALAS